MAKSIDALRTVLLGCAFASAFLGGADARKLHVLFTFQGEPDGAMPQAGLLMGNDRNLYGTTLEGGPLNLGTVFKVTRRGSESVLHAFEPATEGYYPFGGLVTDTADNLYGTLYFGPGSGGHGSVFKIAPDGTTTILHAFTGGSDGAYPYGTLLIDNSGNLYGTTLNGGAGNNLGVVFRLAPDGTETLLYVFQGVCCGRSDGSFPQGGLVSDASGNLYGTTRNGGDSACDCGTVYKLAADGTETVIHAFGDGPEGIHPGAGLTMDKSSNLYGTTMMEGVGGEGAAFRIAPDGTLTVLHAFAGGSDGADPMAALMMDGQGNLYGTTYQGGDSVCDCGTIFEITRRGSERILHAFTGPPDGVFSYSPLIMDNRGNFYGTAAEGGNSNNDGLVFKFKEKSK